MKPEKGGVPVMLSQVTKLDLNISNLAAGVTECLTDFIGIGGMFEGW